MYREFFNKLDVLSVINLKKNNKEFKECIELFTKEGSHNEA